MNWQSRSSRIPPLTTRRISVVRWLLASSQHWPSRLIGLRRDSRELLCERVGAIKQSPPLVHPPWAASMITILHPTTCAQWIRPIELANSQLLTRLSWVKCPSLRRIDGWLSKSLQPWVTLSSNWERDQESPSTKGRSFSYSWKAPLERKETDEASDCFFLNIAAIN